MRAYPITVLAGGINRLRVKGGAAANSLYDLQNAWITNVGAVQPREGTIRTVTLDSSTVGLAAANGQFNIFSSAFSTATLATGYVLNVLSDPNDRTQPVEKIWFAKPFMGFEYIVAQFNNGDIWHYWLQNNGTWTSSTPYTTASIILPPTPNGIAYQGLRDFPVQPLWTPDTTITLGSFVEPNTPTGFAYEAVAVTGPDSDVSLLLHMDGTNGSTTFLDASTYANVMTGTAGVAISTSNPKFGTGAALWTLSTASITTPITAGGPLDIGAGDFTIEGWFNYTSGAAANTLLVSGLTTNGGPGWWVSAYYQGGGAIQLQFNWYIGVTQYSVHVDQFVPSAGTWYSWSVVRISSVYTIYVNGAGSATPTTQAGTILPAASITLGATVLGNAFPGMQDEIRITKGIGLYAAPYTPVSSAFPNPTASATGPAHTGASEPVWPTTSGSIIQEFGDFDLSATDAGTTQSNNGVYSTATALGSNITDRYGNSATVSNAGIFATSSTLSSLTFATTKITTWKAGTNYAPGAVVIPTTNQGAFINAIPNGDFEGGSGAGGWDFTDPGGGAGEWAYSSVLPYQGLECITIPGGTSFGSQGAYATMTSYSLVTPGQSVTATAYLDPNNSGANLTLWLQLNWYDITDTIISSSGYQQNEQEGGGYRKTTVTGVAPVGAAHCRASIGAGSGTTSRNAGFADLVSWNLETAAPITNFLFEAVQPAAGSSAATEPTWPTTLNGEVIDGGVTWEAIGTSIITWQAVPLMQSGLTAPTFPTTIGNSVSDSSTFVDQNGRVIDTSMSWEAVDRHIADPKCPQTLAVTIGASHVFAGDNDIADYSAAVNPTDWTSTNNAGYLPTGLNNYGDNPIAVLALYRSNLMVFNAGGYQMWQIDPDPQNMALLDAQPIGSIWPRAAQSVANDLLFLTEVGVRNLGTVGPTANMAVGNTGQPIDPLVLAQIQAATYDPLSIYYPGRGQYWLIYGPQVFVLTINGTSGTKSWSRYIFPEAITDATLNEGYLYLRTATNVVWQVNAEAVGIDDANTITTAATPVAFNGVMQWPYLDMGSLGRNKMLIGIDLVGEGACIIQVAFNQADKSTFNDNAGFAMSTGVTTPYAIAVDDTVPGQPLPIPINAPSYSIILTFTGSTSSPNAWSWEAANIYITDAGSAGAMG